MMKLENCGRCGLEPVVEVEKYEVDGGPGAEYARCPAGHCMERLERWNSDQFATKTARINAAAVAICTGQKANDSFEGDVLDAEELIEMEDARARVRWAEMQKGE